MKVKVKRFEEKYKAQDKLLDSWLLRDLDRRTLHQTIKAMLVNTTNDCIMFECAMDPETETISCLMQKKEITPEEYKKFKESQARLKTALHLAQVSENSLENLLYEMMMSDEIKIAFKQEIPELYEGLFYMLDIEKDILNILVPELSEQYETNYKEICSIINRCIADFVENVEEYIPGVEKRDLYIEFVELRKEWRKKREAINNE